MKSMIIILLAVVLIAPFSAFAQESLIELGDRLDEENLQTAEDAGSIVDPFGSNIPQETIEVIGEPDYTDSTNNQIILVFLIIGLIISGFIILKKRSSSQKVDNSES